MSDCLTLSGEFVTICDVLHDLVPFAQFKKREKNPWRNVTFSKVAGYPPCFTFFKLYN